MSHLACIHKAGAAGQDGQQEDAEQVSGGERGHSCRAAAAARGAVSLTHARRASAGVVKIEQASGNVGALGRSASTEEGRRASGLSPAFVAPLH